MSDTFVRQATLADTYAITDIHCSNVPEGVFTRRNFDGTRTPVPYEELSLYERYMNGGPWMSVETCAVWLAHMLRYGDEMPLVAEADGMVLAEAEVTIGNEPAPYGRHLNIVTFNVHAESHGQGLGTALLDYIKHMARVMKVHQVLVARPQSLSFWKKHDFKPLVARREALVPTREGRVFYKAVQLGNFDHQQIDGWAMPAGRFQSARHEWINIWPGFWNCVPELAEPEIARFDVSLAGQHGILILQQDRFNPERANTYLWTERPLTQHMISAVRDRAARDGYQELSLFVDDQALAFVEADATEVQNAQMLYSWRVS